MFAQTGCISPEYCSQPMAEGQAVCRGSDAFQQWTIKQKNNPIFKAYCKEYKRRFAWIKAGHITAEAFYVWSRQVREKYQECRQGQMSLEEFQAWLKKEADMNSCNTDLEQVKLVAHALLNVEIQPTEFSSMAASHPFTNTMNSKRACPSMRQALFLVNIFCTTYHLLCSETEDCDILRSLCTAWVIHKNNWLAVGHECCKQIADSVGHQSCAEDHDHQLGGVEGVDDEDNAQHEGDQGGEK